MIQSVIKSVNYWKKRSARKDHQHKMVFLNQNKKRYDWDNSDIDYNAGTPPLYELPAELPGIDLETDNIDTSVVIPTIAQFYA